MGLTKTPEQMAEELADQWAKRDTNHWKDIKGAFFAGYRKFQRMTAAIVFYCSEQIDLS